MAQGYFITMRIVVLGAGTVGSSIASLLCAHRHSVTVVDSDSENISRLNESLDVRTVLGSAAQSSVLFQAGVGTADLCLAVTGEDEVNIIAASMAKAMGARRAVSRVYAPVFRDLSTFDYQEHFKLDRMLSLEHLSAVELARRIRSPGSVIVENLARGEIEIHEVEVTKKTAWAGKKIKELSLPKNIRIGSISSHERTARIAVADDQIDIGDRLSLIGKRRNIETLTDAILGDASKPQNIVIAGGGETGYHLAQILEEPGFNVSLFESNRERCDYLASSLKEATVIHCDATRRASLEEERVGRADVFIACTGDDENNIMAAVEARDLGTPTIMALIGRPDYALVIGKLGIDHAVSPREVIAKEILSYLNSGPVLSRVALGESELSILEIEVEENALATEHVLAKLEFPEHCVIAAIVHDGFTQVPGAGDRLHTGDMAVVLVRNDDLEETVKMFEAIVAP